jgi:hypothetical protein
MPTDPAPAAWMPGPGRHDDNGEIDIALPRSFLTNTRPTRGVEVIDDRAPTVRAYLITQGRTTSTSALGFESMVTIAGGPGSAPDSLQFERAQIYTICLDSGAQSIAELSAHLSLPIGVVKVIAGDLVSEGYFNAHESQVDLSTDVQMLRRLIHGVRAL